MIGLVLGTSEGKKILEELNQFTDDLFVTTATEYGGELLKNYKYKVLNTEPVDFEGFKEKIKEYDIEVFLDATHPYAVEVSKNIMKACSECGIPYIRYERESVSERYRENELVTIVEGYEGIKEAVAELQGVIFNTTGSRNIPKILELSLKNRIIHRVLPTMKVMEEIVERKIQPQDVIMIKGPIGYELNKAFYKEYNVEWVLMKDSGLAGGTKEKIEAAIHCGLRVVLIKRARMEYPIRYQSISKCVEDIRERCGNESKLL